MRFLELYLKAFGPFSDRRIVFPSSEERVSKGSRSEGRDAEQGAGLVVIHGQNEAGKSSALRAIRDFLYGIPLRSADDFVHRHKDMRVGARIAFADGEELAAIRRKGNRDTLRDYEDRDPIQAERLLALTQRVPEALFESFYGLDHRGLTQGSKALLEDEGELGRALFGAGLGAGNLRAVLEALDREAAELFTARGSKPRINAAIAAWKASQSAIKAESLRPQDWEEQARRVSEAEAELEALGQSLEETSRERSRLRRIKLALPPLARREHWQTLAADLPSVTPLRDDFEERLVRARADRRDAEQARERTEGILERQSARREALLLDPALLEARERIELLHRGVTGYRDTREQLPRRQSELARLDAEIEETAQVLDAAVALRPSETPEAGGVRSPDAKPASDASDTPDTPDASDASDTSDTSGVLGDLDDSQGRIAGEASEWPAARSRALRAVRDRSPRIQELASEWAGHETRLASAKDELAEAEAESRRLREALDGDAPPADLEPLRRALARATRLGDIDVRILVREREVQGLAEECARSLERLSLGALGEEELERTAFPSHEALDAFAERFDASEGIRSRIDETCRRLREGCAEADESLARLEGERDVPSESDLAARRGERDEAWRRLRRDFVAGASDSTSGSASDARQQLAERVGEAIGAADEVADRLRVDADRVARHSDLRARRARLDSELGAAQSELERVLAEAEVVATEWSARWRAVGVEPRSVDEMRSWRRGLDQLLEGLEALRSGRADLAGSQAERDEACSALTAVLADSFSSDRSSDRPSEGPSEGATGGERLDALLDLAHDELERGEAAAFEHRRRAEALEGARIRVERGERECERALRALDDWRSQWSDAIEGLGLRASERPKEALARLDSIRRLMDALRERDQLADRIGKMRANVERFEAETNALIEVCAPSLVGFAAEAAALRLQDMLREARDQDLLRVEIEQAIAEARDERTSAESGLTATAELLAALAAEAGVRDEDAIDATLRTWKKLAEAQAGVREAEQRLAEIGEGRSIEALAEESRAIDPDALDGQIERLEARYAEAGERRDRAIAELRSRRDELAAMDGTGRVAERAEEAQSVLARLRRDAERYVDLRLAKEILEREIDGYRQRNQAPVLKRAGEIFGLLTREAYPNIVTDAGEGGSDAGRNAARLMAVNLAGAEVPVDGLSSGTRDQLYLALRLATLEESLGRTPGEVEPMPLIADDILVEFDDDRSRATLEVLAQVANKTQILLFSHHRHVADSARELGPLAHVVEL